MSRNTDMEADVSQMRAGLPRQAVPLSYRVLAGLLRLSGVDDVAKATEQQLIDGQTPFPRNFMTSAIFGKVHPRVEVFQRTLPDGLTVRVYRTRNSESPLPAVLYMHGGGWVSGDVGMTDWWCSRLALQASVVVVSVAYRLAPLHRFPEGLEDCYDTLCWVADNHRKLGVDPRRVSVAGDSAGANLAAALCLYARDVGGPGIERQTLIYPSLDFEFRSPSMREEADAPLLTARAVEAYVGHYLGPDGIDEKRRDPYASPLHAEDLRGLPSALIQVGEHDPLRDDGWRYGSRLRGSGVAATVTEYAGMPHGFALFRGLAAATRQALNEAVHFHL